MNAQIHTRRAALTALALGAASMLAPSWAQAQSYPTRPINYNLAFALGGGSDIVARAIQRPVEKALGQPLIIEAKVGGSGVVATRFVARAPADGYTLLQQTNGMLITPHVNKQAGFDPLKDFEPVAFLGFQPMILVAHPSVPARNVKEFIAYAKANPMKIEFASSGAASNGRMATERFMNQAGITMLHVPYSGVGQITQALLRGDAKIMLSSTTPQINQFIEEGKLKLLGVASLDASPLFPGAEPIARTLPGFQGEVWHLLFAPRGTPRETVDRLNKDINAALTNPEVQAALIAAGTTVEAFTPAALRTKLEKEYQVWGELVEKTGIKVE